jgi:pimeloyl-ACP methyl ester carboxylesterase
MKREFMLLGFFRSLERSLRWMERARAEVAVLPRMSDHILQHCKTATASWYDGIGHVPFLEAPARFNAELAAFARGAFSAR